MRSDTKLPTDIENASTQIKTTPEIIISEEWKKKIESSHAAKLGRKDEDKYFSQ